LFYDSKISVCTHVPTSWKKQHICSMGYVGLLGSVEIHLILLGEGLEARVALDALNGGCSSLIPFSIPTHERLLRPHRSWHGPVEHGQTSQLSRRAARPSMMASCSTTLMVSSSPPSVLVAATAARAQFFDRAPLLLKSVEASGQVWAKRPGMANGGGALGVEDADEAQQPRTGSHVEERPRWRRGTTVFASAVEDRVFPLR
jgi:hypothetical protein